MTLHDCGISLLHPQAANFFLGAGRPVPTGNPHPNLVPYGKYAARGGDIFIASGNNGQFRKLCAVLGLEHLAADPRYASNALRMANRADLDAALNAAFAATDAQDIALRLMQAGVPAGPVLTVDAVVQAPHTLHREMVVDIDGFRGIGTPIKLSRTPGGARARPPRFAEHAAEILRAHGYTDDDLAALAQDGVLHGTRRV
jgi:formyl-CoA transferase